MTGEWRIVIDPALNQPSLLIGACICIHCIEVVKIM